NQLDPRLQRIVARHRQGIARAATSSTGTNEVAVVARVTDAAQWENLSEVRLGAVVSKTGNDASDIVTGLIPVSRIESVRTCAVVQRLKAPQRLRPVLDATVPDIGAAPSSTTIANGAKGVIVGVVDFGCDFAHKNFRNKDGSSRLLAIWDQSGTTVPGSP